MSNVVQFRPSPRPPAQPSVDDAYGALALALAVARASGTIRDMAAAVRAYEAWLSVAIPDPVERAEIWP